MSREPPDDRGLAARRSTTIVVQYCRRLWTSRGEPAVVPLAVASRAHTATTCSDVPRPNSSSVGPSKNALAVAQRVMARTLLQRQSRLVSTDAWRPCSHPRASRWLPVHDAADPFGHPASTGGAEAIAARSHRCGPAARKLMALGPMAPHTRHPNTSAALLTEDRMRGCMLGGQRYFVQLVLSSRQR